MRRLFWAIILLSNAAAHPRRRSYDFKYTPEISKDGNREIHQYKDRKMEVLLSYGLTPQIRQTAENAINDYYSGELYTQGYEVDKISQVMESEYGGLWQVAIFPDPYLFASTIQRRSQCFMVIDVDGIGITLSREAGT